MYTQFLNGQFLSSTFSDTIWTEIAKELHQRTKFNYSVGQLKGKANRLRILWRKFHELITKKTGFGWDPLTCTITTSDERWKVWIAENPGEAKLRTKGLPHYHTCTEMFGNSVATGNLARSSSMCLWDSNEELDLNLGPRGGSLGSLSRVGSPLGNVQGDAGVDMSESPENSALAMARERKSSKSNRSSRIDKALDAWASVNSAKVRKLNKSKSDSVENCIEALRRMEGLPRLLFFLAQDSFLSKVRRKMFLLMNNEERRAWVESLSA